MKYFGGEPIAAGGYGCVFYPALKCVTEAERSTGISKLMRREKAAEEMNEIDRIKPLLSLIPNFRDLFVIDGFYQCTPDTLDVNDLHNFDKVCENSVAPINASTVNSNLEILRIVNQPYGGEKLTKVIKNIKHITELTAKLQQVFHLHEALTFLLFHGILKLSDYGVVHSDVKPDNLLILDGKVRLIDWGLADVIKTKTNKLKPTYKIPVHQMNYPLFYNRPFGSLLLDDSLDVGGMIKKGFTIDDKGLSAFLQERSFMEVIARQILDQNKNGHYAYIKETMLPMLGVPSGVIIRHLTDVLMAFTNQKGEFEMFSYFNNVYRYNVDVWGLFSCYLELLEPKLNLPYAITENIISLLNKYMVSATVSSVQRYDMDELLVDMDALNTVIEQELAQATAAASASALALASSTLKTPKKYTTAKTKSKVMKSKKSPVTKKGNRRFKKPLALAGGKLKGNRTRKRKQAKLL